MISTRWLAASLSAAALATACSKAAPEAAPTTAAAPAAAAGVTADPAAPAAPGSAHAQGTAPAHGEALPSITNAVGTPVVAKDLVALGADDRAKVIGDPAAGRTIESDSYVLKLSVPAQVPKGAEGVVTLDILPKKGWHLNKEFPTKLSVTPPAGVALTKPEQVLADATAWAEDKGQFSIRFTAADGGPKDFAGKLKFAVCTETTCDPKREELAWSVPVQ